MLAFYLAMLDSENERQSFSRFYEKVKTKCLRVALSITKDKVLAEDAVHDAFMKFIEKKDSYFALPCNKQESLIVIIVRNKAIDIIRKESKPTTDIIDEYGEEILESDFNTESDYESKETYERLLRLIEALPEKYKQVFYLKYVTELDNGEIAESLGISKEHVAVRLKRAKDKLRIMLEEGGDGYGR